jgi:hypothetical protein
MPPDIRTDYGLAMALALLGLSAAPPQTHRATVHGSGLSTVGCPYGCRPSPTAYAEPRPIRQCPFWDMGF